MQKKLSKKNQHPFTIKKTPESRHRGNLPQHNKGHIWQTHSQHRPQWWENETISTKIRNNTRLPTLTTIIQHSFGSFNHSNRKEKEIKRIQIRKEEVKLSPFADDMVLYIEDPKDVTRKLLELINEFATVAAYKRNAKKSLAFLYTNDELSESEIKKTLPFTTAKKKKQ